MFHESSMSRLWRTVIALFVGLALVAVPSMSANSFAKSTPKSPIKAKALTYTNPILAKIPGSKRLVESCADPSVIYGKAQKTWYVYCTSDPLNAFDPSAHAIPVLKSKDLSHFTYVGDALKFAPNWVKGTALWAPDIRFLNGKYYLYYTAPETQVGGSAIGVATSSKPTGPFKDAGRPVVEPHPAPCAPGCGKDTMWTFDPALVNDNGQLYIFYGSYFGGIQARKLSADGLHSDPASQTQITIDNQYEGSYIVKHGDYWYLFGSASDCCNGPLTGYSVFVGRSTRVLGPYLDQSGHSMLESRAGGTTSVTMNGNRFVGPGHNAVFTDFAGQDWMIYHAIDRNKPYLIPNSTSPNRRPLMMDPLDWVNGWPVVRGGLGPSDTKMPAPAAQPKQKSHYTMKTAGMPQLGARIDSLSDEFNGTALGTQWTWVRQPKSSEYAVESGNLRLNTQDGDLYVDQNNAPVLTEPAPQGDYVVETRVNLNVPEGCCYNFRQAGLIIYGDDDNYVRAMYVSFWGTRHVEFAKEWKPVPKTLWPRYGSGWRQPVAEWTWIRVYKTTSGQTELYHLYLSVDGTTWNDGGVWTHTLGSKARIALGAMGGSGSVARFDYVRVYQLQK